MTDREVKITVDPSVPLIGIGAIDASTQGGRVIDDQAPWVYLLAPAPPEYVEAVGVMKCDRCHLIVVVPKAMNMGVFSKVSDDFMATHRKCAA